MSEYLSAAELQILTGFDAVRPRHFPFDFLHRRPHPRDMRRPASVSVEAGQVGQVAFDVGQADVDVLATLHFRASLEA